MLYVNGKWALYVVGRMVGERNIVMPLSTVSEIRGLLVRGVSWHRIAIEYYPFQDERVVKSAYEKRLPEYEATERKWNTSRYVGAV